MDCTCGRRTPVPENHAIDCPIYINVRHNLGKPRMDTDNQSFEIVVKLVDVPEQVYNLAEKLTPAQKDKLKELVREYLIQIKEEI